MNLIRRSNSPLSTMRGGPMEEQFGHMVENMFHDFLAPLAQGGRRLEEGLALPRLDVSETEKTFEVQAELPGVKKDDIKVAIDGQRVTIEGEYHQGNEARRGERVMYSGRSQRFTWLITQLEKAGA
jgi:HSP20 family protein